jgi:hypothetical protein
MFALLHVQPAHVPPGLGAGWAADYPAASQSFTGVFTASGRGQINNIGVDPAQLEEWGYQVTEAPSVDERIADCQGQPSGTDASCWARLDQYMMEQVVPWVPYVLFTQYRTYRRGSRDSRSIGSGICRRSIRSRSPRDPSELDRYLIGPQPDPAS